MQRLELTGHITDEGKLTIHNRIAVEEWAMQNPGRNILVKFEKRGSKRSHPQNAYYWSCVVHSVMMGLREIGYSFTTEADKVKATCDDLSIKVSDGFEMRDIQCWVEYNKPSTGQKQITRIDTAEVFTEPMTEEDWTLFNQA